MRSIPISKKFLVWRGENYFLHERCGFCSFARKTFVLLPQIAAQSFLIQMTVFLFIVIFLNWKQSKTENICVYVYLYM